LGFLRDKVSLRLKRGWPEEESLLTALFSNRSKDLARGHTIAGSHRDDLEVLIGGNPAAEVLSRGQLKRVMCALFLARAELLLVKIGKKCLFLLDDLMSELDLDSAKIVLQGLAEYSGQVIITCLSAQDVIAAWDDDNVAADNNGLPEGFKMFHVEQGRIYESGLFHVEPISNIEMINQR